MEKSNKVNMVLPKKTGGVITFGIPRELCDALGWGKNPDLKFLKLTAHEGTLLISECAEGSAKYPPTWLDYKKQGIDDSMEVL